MERSRQRLKLKDFEETVSITSVIKEINFLKM